MLKFIFFSGGKYISWAWNNYDYHLANLTLPWVRVFLAISSYHVAIIVVGKLPLEVNIHILIKRVVLLCTPPLMWPVQTNCLMFWYRLYTESNRYLYSKLGNQRLSLQGNQARFVSFNLRVSHDEIISVLCMLDCVDKFTSNRAN